MDIDARYLHDDSRQVAVTVVGNLLQPTSNADRPPQEVCDQIADHHIAILRKMGKES